MSMKTKMGGEREERAMNFEVVIKKTEKRELA
jgi:hypothetical protein